MVIKPSFCTFIFGNGFDLSLGMKTRFIDMYDEYIKSISTYQTGLEKKWITKFKNYIKNDGPKYNTWADFELALGRYSKNCDSAEELIKCERDFKIFLRVYLKNEENRMLNIIAKLQKEYIWTFSNFCIKFYQRNDLTENEKTVIDKYYYNTVKYYISFNYTQNVLNSLVNSNRPIYVHGTLDNDIILGVDNETQISLPLDEASKRAIIKPIYNETVDSNKVNTIKKILWDSKIICSFGLSLGATDFTWVKEIINAIVSNNCLWIHYLFLDEELLFYDLIESLNQREKLKKEFLRKLSIPQEIYKKINDKVFVFPITKSPFNFPQIERDN